MKLKITLAASLLIVIGAGILGCNATTTNLPTTLEPALEQTPSPVNAIHETERFHLSSNTQPARYSEYGAYSFPVYLETEQELYVSFYAESDERHAVCVQVIFPSGDKLGYKTTSGMGGNIKDTGLGTLKKGCNYAEEGHFILQPPQQGYYTIQTIAGSNVCEIDVVIDYWVK